MTTKKIRRKIMRVQYTVLFLLSCSSSIVNVLIVLKRLNKGKQVLHLTIRQYLLLSRSSALLL